MRVRKATKCWLSILTGMGAFFILASLLGRASPVAAPRAQPMSTCEFCAGLQIRVLLLPPCQEQVAAQLTLGLGKNVLAQWEAWAWKQAFPNPNEEIKKVMNAKCAEEMIEAAQKAFAGLDNLPHRAVQYATLAMTLLYLRTTLKLNSGIICTVGRQDGKTWLKGLSFDPETVWSGEVDLSPVKIGNFSPGKLSCALRGDLFPSGVLDLVQDAQDDPIMVTGDMSYEIRISVAGVTLLTSTCLQDWELRVHGDIVCFQPKLAEGFQ